MYRSSEAVRKSAEDEDGLTPAPGRLSSTSPKAARKRVYEPRPCAWPPCGVVFTPNRPFHAFHASKCRFNAWQAEEKAKAAAELEAHERWIATWWVE